MKFWIGTVIGVAGSFLVWGGMLYWQSGRATLSSQWIADAYERKGEIASGVRGERIVIVAGSNALFGIDSSMIEKAYGRESVNYGVNAGLLLPYNLLKSKEVLRRGDIVLMPLEYHFFTYDGRPNIQMIDQIWSRNRGYFWELSLYEQWMMVWLTPALRVYEGMVAKGGAKTMCGPYGSDNLNDRGDQTHTTSDEAIQWSYDWDNLAKELPRHHAPKEGENHEMGWRWLTEYSAWAKREGICLIAIPPTMMDQPFYHTDAKEREFYETLDEKMEKIGIAYVGDPYRFMYGRERYFNTDYHLNDSGRKMHTQAVIETLGGDLQKWCAQ